MKHIAFYGSSDDLIEIEGDWREEFNGESKSFEIAGLHVSVQYGRSGCWEIRIVQQDEEITVTAEEMKLSIQPLAGMDGSDPGYSMRLDMEVPDDTSLGIETPEGLVLVA